METTDKPLSKRAKLKDVLRELCYEGRGSTTATNAQLADAIDAQAYLPGQHEGVARQSNTVRLELRKLEAAGTIRCDYYPHRVITWLKD